MIGRILVALGGTEYTLTAIDTAVELAKRHNAELTGVTVINLEQLRRIGPVPLGAGELANELRDERIALSREAVDAVVARFEEACKAAGVKHSVLREEHDEACHYLTRLARYHDLAVVGLRAAFKYSEHDAIKDPLVILDRLVSGGVRPLVAVTDQPLHVRKALVAFSGSMEAAKTLRSFVQLNPWPDIEVRIVTFGEDSEDSQRLVADAAAYCQSHGLESTTAVLGGSPNQGILEEADKWGADIIVMGNSHKSLLLRRVLGETVLHVIKNSDKALFLGQ